MAGGEVTAGGGEVADEVRQEMLRVYTTADLPSYLDRTAITLLNEGRANFAMAEAQGFIRREQRTFLEALQP